MSARSLRAAGVLSLLAATLLVHAPRSAEFAYDDGEFVVANQSIRSPTEALRAMLLPFPPEQPERALYRPLTNLSYAVDHAVWGERALGFHVTNLALYCATVLLVALLSAVYLGAGFAFAVALLFALHPVHCEAVDSVAGRSEILALLFGLASLLLFLRAARRPVRRNLALAASTLAYALACLSKESGAMLLPVLAAHALVLGPPEERGWRARLLPLRAHVVVLLAYLVLRGAVLGRFSPEDAVLRGEDLATRLYTIGTVFLVDLRLLVWPSLEVDFFYQAALPIPERPTAAALLGLALLLAAGIGSLALARRHFRAGLHDDATRRRVRATALAALTFFFASWLPTSHVFDIGALVAERFLFAPSLGFLVLAVLAARHALARIPGPSARRAAALGALAALSLVWGVRSHARAAEWRDPVRLWTAAARSLPRDLRVLTNLAAVHLERGELGPARAALERAREIDPSHPAVLGNLGVLQLEQGRLDEAAATYRRLLDLDPADFLAWYNLGLIETERGNHAEAAAHFRRSLSANPNFSLARRGLDVAEAALRDARAAPAQDPR